MKRILLALTVFVCLFTAVFADDIKLMTLTDIDLRLAYSSVSGSTGSWSGNAWLFFLPAIKFNSSDYLLPMLSSSFSTSEKVIEEETLFANRWNNLFSLAYKHKFGDTMDLKVSGDARYNFNMQTRDEVLGKGLYDLYDLGATATLSLYGSADDKNHPVNLTAKYYSRKYPNYPSLASTSGSSSTIDKEKTPKDFGGATFVAESKNSVLGVNTDLSYSLLLKGYYDDYTVDLNGVLTDTKRNDTVHFIDLGLSCPFGDSMTAGIDFDYNIYSSNGNVFDSNVLKFQDNYYGYTSLSARPNAFMLVGGFTVGVYYQYLIRNYTARNARDSAGNYLAATETDYEHTIGLNARLPLSKGVSWVTGASYFITTSNMAYEQYVKYTYQILSVSSGFSFSL